MDLINLYGLDAFVVLIFVGTVAYTVWLFQR
jgi:hypothetical protein